MRIAIYSLQDGRATQILQGDPATLFFIIQGINTELFTALIFDDTIHSEINTVAELPPLSEMNNA